ncbi:MAG: 50S ribosomal protein L9 [Anaerolineaceae bacterium]|jgi:large subunit ribosomal protein L9
MKVLLMKDVYKLGRAGDVKRVADGFGRNFLLPQGLAVLATLGSLKQVDHIRAQAALRRNALNTEMGSVAEQVNGVVLSFASKAGETGKLYGSITPQMVAEALNQKLNTKIDRHNVEMQPIRTLGDFKARVRLTVDLTPEVKILVHREGETPVQAVDLPAAENKPAPAEEPAAVEKAA